jgi:hypothetical protein
MYAVSADCEGYIDAIVHEEKCFVRFSEVAQVFS